MSNFNLTTAGAAGDKLLGTVGSSISTVLSSIASKTVSSENPYIKWTSIALTLGSALFVGKIYNRGHNQYRANQQAVNKDLLAIEEKTLNLAADGKNANFAFFNNSWVKTPVNFLANNIVYKPLSTIGGFLYNFAPNFAINAINALIDNSFFKFFGISKITEVSFAQAVDAKGIALAKPTYAQLENFIKLEKSLPAVKAYIAAKNTLDKAMHKDVDGNDLITITAGQANSQDAKATKALVAPITIDDKDGTMKFDAATAALDTDHVLVKDADKSLQDAVKAYNAGVKLGLDKQELSALENIQTIKGGYINR